MGRGKRAKRKIAECRGGRRSEKNRIQEISRKKAGAWDIMGGGRNCKNAYRQEAETPPSAMRMVGLN